MEELCAAKKVRAIGVCNCVIHHLEWICETGGPVPAVNQVERHPLRNEKVLQNWCSAHGIQMEAWAPLMRGNLDLPEIVSLSEKYHRTPAQIILRWDIQSGVVVIPKSVHRSRIFENADLFNFSLSPEDMQIIDGMDTGYTTSHDPQTFDY